MNHSMLQQNHLHPFNDKIKFFEIAESKTAANFIERNMFSCTQTLLPHNLCTFKRNFLCFSFIFIYTEFFTRLWGTIQTKYLYRSRGRSCICALVTLIEHCLCSSVELTTHHNI